MEELVRNPKFTEKILTALLKRRFPEADLSIINNYRLNPLLIDDKDKKKHHKEIESIENTKGLLFFRLMLSNDSKECFYDQETRPVSNQDILQRLLTKDKSATTRLAVV